MRIFGSLNLLAFVVGMPWLIDWLCVSKPIYEPSLVVVVVFAWVCLFFWAWALITIGSNDV